MPAPKKDLRERAKGGMRMMEQLETIIPGFSGYKEKELRREADKLLREELAASLKELDSEVDSAYEDMVENKMVKTYQSMDTITALMDKIISKVELADYGYAGFFNAVKIGEDALDRMYEFDSALFSDVEKTRKAVQALADDVAGDGAGAERLAKELKASVIDFDKKFDKRKGVMLAFE